MDTSQSFDVDEYSVYFQLHHDSSGQVITVTLGSVTEKPRERSKGGTLLFFLSTWNCRIVLVASLVLSAYIDHLFICSCLFLSFLPSLSK